MSVLSVLYMIRLPLYEKPHVRTGFAVGNVYLAWAVRASHILQVLSAEPDMKFTVCQSMSIHHTAPLWPLYVPRRSPFSENHTLGFLSFDEENIKSPSRLYLICVMERSCPCSKIGFFQTNKKLKICAPYNTATVTRLQIYHFWNKMLSVLTFSDMVFIYNASAKIFMKQTKKYWKQSKKLSEKNKEGKTYWNFLLLFCFNFHFWSIDACASFFTIHIYVN